MKKTKILQFPIGHLMGGRTVYVLNQWKYIDKEKIHFDFVTFSSKLDYEKELEKDGCTIYHLPCYPAEDKEQFTKEFIKILDNGYDAIEIHTSSWDNLIVEEIAKDYGIKRIIIHAHSSGCSKNRITETHEMIRKEITTEIATDFWACSKSASKWLFGDNIPEDKIVIVPNAIDTKKFYYNPVKREQLRNELGLEGNLVLGQVGRIAFPKNHRFSLTLVKKLVPLIPNIKLIIIGDGAERNDVEQTINELDLENYVTIEGKKSNVEDWLQAIDIFIMPSYFEGFPIALLEAMSTGLRCVCSDNISSEVVLTDEVKRLPLNNIDLWIQEIVLSQYGYKRINKSEIICNAGYDTKESIHILEKEYLRKV